MSAIGDRYRRRADIFERKVAAVDPSEWSNQSPCEDWTARDVVRHVVDMHAAMLRPVGRALTPAPSVDEDPLAAFQQARADVARLLDDREVAATTVRTPAGEMSTEDHVDQVVSQDLVVHGWDLARATGQDETIDPAEVEAMWPAAQEIPDVMRVPGAFGPGIVVYGPAVDLPADSPMQDRLLGLLGRDPR